MTSYNRLRSLRSDEILSVLTRLWVSRWENVSMEHVAAVGDVLAIWGTKDSDGNERQYVIREHGEIGTMDCQRAGTHLHLVEITDLTSGFTPVMDVHIADELIIGDVRHAWARVEPSGYVLAPR